MIPSQQCNKPSADSVLKKGRLWTSVIIGVLAIGRPFRLKLMCSNPIFFIMKRIRSVFYKKFIIGIHYYFILSHWFMSKISSCCQLLEFFSCSFCDSGFQCSFRRLLFHSDINHFWRCTHQKFSAQLFAAGRTTSRANLIVTRPIQAAKAPNPLPRCW